MAPPLLTLKNIALSFGSTPLLECADMSISQGERLCLVGRNGSGKSTLLKIAAGQIEPDGGERFVKPGTTIRYLEQDPDLSGYDNIRSYIESGLEGVDTGATIPAFLDALGLDGNASPAHLSGGEARRAALARVLVSTPDILMLDEPTNHLDLPIILWLENHLQFYSGALVLISHDRQFLSALTQSTLWVDRGETRLVGQGFARFEDWRDTFLENEELERHKLARKIVREQHWVVHGVSGRRKRNVRRLKELGSLRSQKAGEKSVVGKAKISVTEGGRAGKKVVELVDISKSFGDKTVIDHFSARILRGDRVGIVGPNGSGKTTLLKIIMGQLAPDTGTADLGVNLQPLILDQNRTGLDPNTTLKDALTGGGGDSVMVGDVQKHVIGYMKDFLFLPEQQRTPIHRLSGGERARLELARGLCLPSNLLILDEPTNDLDLETLDLLQELIAEYKGTVILVSHDRDFLNRTVRSTLAFEGNGKWLQYAGGYNDMIRQRKKQAKAEKALLNAQASKTPAPKTGNTPKPSSGPRGKMSYKHKYRLEVLPGLMRDTEEMIRQLTGKMAVPDFYTQDQQGFERTAQKLDTKKAELEGLENEWMELEDMRDQLES
jgi:ATP-binding cassette subfamily F protein uup